MSATCLRSVQLCVQHATDARVHLHAAADSCVRCTDDGELMSFAAAVSESAELPVDVRLVAPVNHESRDVYQQVLGQQWTISQLYDATFLLANPIHSGAYAVSNVSVGVNQKFLTWLE